MFNVTVLKMRDIIKYLVGTAITIIIVTCATRYFLNYSNKDDKQIVKDTSFNIGNLSNINLTKVLNFQIAAIKNINEEYDKIEKENKKNNSFNYLEEFLRTEITAMKEVDNNYKKIDVAETVKNNTEENNREKEEKSETLQTATTQKVETEIVTQNPITESYNVQYNNVKIKNQTSYTLTQEMLTPDIKIENKNILIFHTHSCESYTPSEKYPYTQTGNFRTTDLNYTVTRVGTELENYLKMYNYNVIHDTSYHDYPAYTGSYTRSLSTVENILKNNSSDIIIDLHRDAIGSRSDYAPTVKIGDEYAAQIMFVIGTNRRRFVASKLESKFKICN